jgi:acetoacetyl-CoA synthetase
MWFSTTAWMMWNALISALLVRASIVMIDGDPQWPDLGFQWRVAEETQPSFMGVSPTFLTACRKAGLQFGRDFDLASIRTVGFAGSPLPSEGYHYVYEQLGPDVLCLNGSGGTDICGAFVSGSFLQPVYDGEISGCCLGADVRAYDADGNRVVGELGEMVVTEPMPSMPVRFWNDPDGERYRSSYFDVYPGVWRQGDWILFTERGSCVITGRSDATLNRGGVRMGTSELYAVVEEVDEVVDSLIVHLEDAQGGPGELLLFVVLADRGSLSDELRGRIAGALRGQLSPRHVPDVIVAVPAVPRTFTGKKLEAPVKRILLGARAEEVASRDALVDPAAIDAFVTYAAGSSRTTERAGLSSRSPS